MRYFSAFSTCSMVPVRANGSAVARTRAHRGTLTGLGVDDALAVELGHRKAEALEHLSAAGFRLAPSRQAAQAQACLLVQRRPVVHLLGSAVCAAALRKGEGSRPKGLARVSAVGPPEDTRGGHRTCSCAALSCAERSAPQSRRQALRQAASASVNSQRAQPWKRSAARAPPSLKSRAMFFFGRDSGMSSTWERALGRISDPAFAPWRADRRTH